MVAFVRQILHAYGEKHMHRAVRRWRTGAAVLLVGLVLAAFALTRARESGPEAAESGGTPTAHTDGTSLNASASPSPSPHTPVSSRAPTPHASASPSPGAGAASASPSTRPVCDNAHPALDVGVAAGGDIQAAIDRVAAAGGGCVNLAEGSWTLRRSVRMKGGVTLNGSGASTLLQGPTSVYDYPLIDSDGTVPQTNMTVENMVLDGRIPPSARTTDPDANNPYADAMGILFAAYRANHRHVLIKNVEVRHTSMGIHIKGTTGVTLDGVNVHHNGIAFWLHNVYLRRCSDVVIVRSRMNDSLVGTGLHVAGDSRNITITDSNFSGNNSSGMNIQDLPANVTIRGSRMIGNNGDGISAVGTRLVITDNQARDNADSGIHTWTGTGQVDGNTASGNKSENLDIHGHFSISDNIGH
ncbi:right-handed parallel beta-helix repeat-containing protein [Streptomyces sp. NPDC094038]|uniref:right-handed parallel beta-helix repeat-containing protein n=1 Tax=Streptomyces sp. NPDC094038 TaxID=3366055 RepID=UPI003817B362